MWVKFRKKFPTIRQLVNKYKRTGSVHDEKRSGQVPMSKDTLESFSKSFLVDSTVFSDIRACLLRFPAETKYPPLNLLTSWHTVDPILPNFFWNFFLISFFPDFNHKMSVLFCDLSRTFSTISHIFLLEKLSKYGFQSSINKLLKLYLRSVTCSKSSERWIYVL